MLASVLEISPIYPFSMSTLIFDTSFLTSSELLGFLIKHLENNEQ